MLKRVVLGLVVANGLFWAWSHGVFDMGAGRSSESVREPQRLQAQQFPERMRLVVMAPSRKEEAASAAAAASAVSPRPTGSACLEVGPYTPAEFGPVEAVLKAQLPPERWTVLSRQTPGSWMVYIGRYARRNVMERRAAELREQNFDVSEVREPQWMPGLSLGVFGQEEEAQTLLRALHDKGAKAARIVVLTAPGTSKTVRVPDADDTVKARIQALTARQLGGQSFGPCLSD